MPPPATMHAVVTTAYGPPEVLHVETLSVPLPKPGELLVRVRAVGVNPIDWMIRKGRFRFLTGRTPPLILGVDLAGEVAAVGPGVSRFKVGDRILASLEGMKGGAYADYAAFPEAWAARKPENVTFEEAAALPVGALTALQALRHSARVQPGEHVLINGASGGVGTVAVQIAKVLGAEVTAVASAGRESLLRKLGADHFLDYKKEDFTRHAKTYDVVFDVHGGRSFLNVRRSLRPGGRFVTTKASPKQWLQKQAARLTRKHVHLIANLRPNGQQLSEVAHLMEIGRVRTVVEKAFRLEKVAEAHRISEKGHAAGKLVLRMRGG